MAKTQEARKPGKFIEQFGRAVRISRADRRLTQQAVADLAGVDVVRIGEIESEKANPRIGTIERVADALGLEVVIRGEVAA